MTGKKVSFWDDRSNLLENNFHDSDMLEIFKQKDQLIIVFDIDTFWSPGKPFGVLTLVNPDKTDEAIDHWNNEVDLPHIQGIEIIRKPFGEHYALECTIGYQAASSKIVIVCSNFWLDRVETYKNHEAKAPYNPVLDTKNKLKKVKKKNE